MKIKSCYGCGSEDFIQNTILWKELIDAWQLNAKDVDIINEQQGYACSNCGMNLRSNVLAKCLLDEFGFIGTLSEFCEKYEKLKILEVNEAGSLHQYLKDIKGLTLSTFPEVDIRSLPYKDSSFDIVIHSDTLEHVDNPIQGLRECFRVLREGGMLCYTVPVLVDRLSRSGSDLTRSFHGEEGNDDYLVTTEYGADFWTEVINAGFSTCTITTLNYPAGIAIKATK